jgi:hypothetical protein
MEHNGESGSKIEGRRGNKQGVWKTFSVFLPPTICNTTGELPPLWLVAGVDNIFGRPRIFSPPLDRSNLTILQDKNGFKRLEAYTTTSEKVSSFGTKLP